MHAVTIASRLTDRTYEYIDLTRQNSGRPPLAVRYTLSRDPEAVHIYTDSTGPPVNHSTNVRGQSPRPPLPLPRTELVSANIEKDNDSAQIGITDSCIDADNLSSLNTVHCIIITVILNFLLEHVLFNSRVIQGLKLTRTKKYLKELVFMYQLW